MAAAGAGACCLLAAVAPAAERMLLLQRVAALPDGCLLLNVLPVLVTAGAADLEALPPLEFVADLPNAREAGCFCWLSLPAGPGGVGILEADSRGTTTTAFFLMGVPDVLPTDSLFCLLLIVFSLPVTDAAIALDVFGLTLTPGFSVVLLLPTGLSARCHFRLSSCLGSIQSVTRCNPLLKHTQAALFHRGLDVGLDQATVLRWYTPYVSNDSSRTPSVAN